MHVSRLGPGVFIDILYISHEMRAVLPACRILRLPHNLKADMIYGKREMGGDLSLPSDYLFLLAC